MTTDFAELHREYTNWQITWGRNDSPEAFVQWKMREELWNLVAQWQEDPDMLGELELWWEEHGTDAP